jgi:signal transduction histidine kinase
MTDPSVPRSPLDRADESFLRAMLEVGGTLLAETVRDAPPADVLAGLCTSARELLGASHVELRVVADAGGLDTSFASGDTTGGRVTHRVPITSADGSTTAELGASWCQIDDHPNELDEDILARFGRLAFLVIERHLAQRRQLEAVAREREALSGEIHDDPIQTMTAMSLRLQRLAAHLPPGDDRSGVEQLRVLADRAIDRLRLLMFSVHPATLEEDGLGAALEVFCEHVVAGGRPVMGVRVGPHGPIPFEIAALGFRLAREAIMNAVTHADASAVGVEVTSLPRSLLLEVRDDGVGFDTSALGHTPPGHFGIAHARTLASSAGGSFTVSSEPGRGTVVEIVLPFL